MNVGELGRIPMSAQLASTLARAAGYADAQSHLEVTLEHLLLALLEDGEAGNVLRSSRVDPARLAGEVSTHIGRIEERRAPGVGGSVAISADLKRILEAAAAAARQGRRKEIDGAIVLAAIVGDGKSTAAHLLRAEGLTFEEAIRALQRATATQPSQSTGRPPEAQPQPQPQPMSEPRAPASTEEILANARERVQTRTAPPAPAPAASAPHPQPAPPSAAQSQSAPLRQGEPAPVDAASPVDMRRETFSPVEPQWQPANLPGSAAQPRHQPPQPPFQPQLHQQPTIVDQPRMPMPPPEHPRTAPPNARPMDAPEGFGAPPAGPPNGMMPPVGPPGTQRRIEPALPQAPVAAPPMSPGPAQQPNSPPGQPMRPLEAPGGAPGPGNGHGHSQGHGQVQAMPPLSQPGPPPGGLPNGFQPGHIPRGPGPQTMPPPGPMGPGGPPQGMQQRPGPPPAGRGAPPFAPPTQAGSAMPPPQRARNGAPAQNVRVAAGQLVENIPRKMRVGMALVVEARVARAEVKAIAEGLQGGGAVYRHEITVTKAMSVRLRAPDGGFWIENASPETQWIDNVLGLMADDYASWRWTITPRERGKHRLQLLVSARTVGADGLAAETALPDQMIEVKVAINYGATLSRWAGWITAAVVGGLLARFGEGLIGPIQKLMGL
ncbi:MAG: Clp protease N-terminal domain-containing protein [Hyphomicrobium sp.]|nr:Clp protease N-terminal domain-containing protein [Hyphomicrobium sp.]